MAVCLAGPAGGEAQNVILFPLLFYISILFVCLAFKWIVSFHPANQNFPTMDTRTTLFFSYEKIIEFSFSILSMLFLLFVMSLVYIRMKHDSLIFTRWKGIMYACFNTNREK